MSEKKPPNAESSESVCYVCEKEGVCKPIPSGYHFCEDHMNLQYSHLGVEEKKPIALSEEEKKALHVKAKKALEELESK